MTNPNPVTPSPTVSAVEAVFLERKAQDLKWGMQNHSPCRWSAILSEESGEVAEACLNFHPARGETVKNLRTEAVQVAAVAVAIIEWIDRGHPYD